jgi:hypothetical protein
VQYAYEHGCPWDAEACAAVLKSSFGFGYGAAKPPAELVQALSVPPIRTEPGAGLKAVKKESDQTQVAMSVSIMHERGQAHVPPNVDDAALLLSVAIKRESDAAHDPSSRATLLSNASSGIKSEGGQARAPPACVALPFKNRGIKRERD